MKKQENENPRGKKYLPLRKNKNCKKTSKIKAPTTYKLDSQKYRYDVSSHKETKFQGSPSPISSNMNSQMVRGFTGCAMSKCKPFLEVKK